MWFHKSLAEQGNAERAFSNLSVMYITQAQIMVLKSTMPTAYALLLLAEQGRI